MKFSMGMPYFLDDHGAVIIGFEFGIKGNTKIDETVNNLDGVERVGGEGFTEAPSKIHFSRAHALELGGIEENHDFTFGGRKSHAILEAPELGALDETKELGVGLRECAMKQRSSTKRRMPIKRAMRGQRTGMVRLGKACWRVRTRSQM